MHPRKLRCFLLMLICFAWISAAQTAREPLPDPSDMRLPNGKSQKEEILKADHEKSLEDASKLIQLSEEFKTELEKNDRHVLSVSMMKKLEEIEKLSKRIRSRLKRY